MKIQEWFMICIVAALVLTIIAGFVSCINDGLEKRQQRAEQNPDKIAEDHCLPCHITVFPE